MRRVLLNTLWHTQYSLKSVPRIPTYLADCPQYLHSSIHNVQHRTYTTASIKPTVQDMIASCMAKLETENVPEANLHAEYMVARVMNIERTSLDLLRDEMLTEAQISKLDHMTTCRLARMPLQYILGDWDFYNITLLLRPPVFIPRPETEQMVCLALKFLKDVHEPRILDLCCGSGAVGLAILHENKNVHCTAIDQSKYAVELSQQNADQLELHQRYSVRKGKITEETLPMELEEQFDVIVTNPPYVLRKDTMKVQPEIALYEDLRALDGGKEGLDVIKPILQNAHHYLKANGKLIMEVDPCHKFLIPTWLESQEDIQLEIEEIHLDIRKLDRFIVYTRK